MGLKVVLTIIIITHIKTKQIYRFKIENQESQIK